MLPRPPGKHSIATGYVASVSSMDPRRRERFREFEQHGTRAPLYARLARSIADDDDLLALLDDAPPTQQLPVLLFAGVHLLVLEGHGPDLARHYPNLTREPAQGDPFDDFRALALRHADRLRQIVATRHTQTNEIGRCALLLPALAAIEAECGPVALVDVGASAGLNLLLAHYGYDYGHGVIGDRRHVVLPCSLRGAAHPDVPVPDRVPAVADAIGLDATPIDVHDEDGVRWLEACVWPDMTDRFARLVAAVELARRLPPRVVRGDAVDDLGTVVAEARRAGHPVVTTSWVLNYLTADGRRAFVDRLDALATEGDMSWVIAESPAETDGLPVPTSHPPEGLTVVSVVRWRNGRRNVRRLGTAHPHGYWLHWD